MSGMVSTLVRWTVRAAAVVTVLVLIGGAYEYWRERQIREALYAAMTPVEITNCDLKRYGSVNDGGYLMCANLLPEAQSSYSYGVAGDDRWGCHLATDFKIPLHQYDCFNTTEPICSSGIDPIFHAECIGPKKETIDGLLFDSLENQFAKNGDTGKRLIIKMDVEGAEWESLLTASDQTLDSIDQLAIEFHEIEKQTYVDAMQRLDKFFYVANIHHNNHVCLPGFDPFPGTVLEALLVNKRIAKPGGVVARGASPLNAPNNPEKVDCQVAPERSEPERIGQWVKRVAGVVGWRLFRIPFATAIIKPE